MMMRGTDGVSCVELGIHDLRGRAISLRWLQHKQPYDVWSPAHYTWLTVILLTVIIIIITFAFKYRQVVSLPFSLMPLSISYPNYI